MSAPGMDIDPTGEAAGEPMAAAVLRGVPAAPGQSERAGRLAATPGTRRVVESCGELTANTRKRVGATPSQSHTTFVGLKRLQPRHGDGCDLD